MCADPCVSRAQALQALRQDGGWRQAAAGLGIAPGLLFMIATGIPADGSGAPELPDLPGATPNLTSPQQLVNPRAHNPLTHDQARAWLKRRAASELTAHAANG